MRRVEVRRWKVKYSRMTRLWLEVLSVKGISSSRWVRITHAISLERIGEMLRSARGREELGRLICRKVSLPDRGFLERKLSHLEDGPYRIISLSDSSYPVLLREVDDPPPVLYVLGDLSVLERPTICIVGSRQASRRGLLTSKQLAFDLSRRGLAVVSGMARGIDRAAHEGALKGEGSTCAVLGCGLSVPYPPEHVELAVDIAKQGCLMSEFPPGTPPLKHHFPQRNRILSGVSLGVVVVEAGIESGAMGTVRWAREQNREVFAVPGPIEHAGSRGPHQLIRQGACLIECADDIIAELPLCGSVIARSDETMHAETLDSFTESERTVLSALELNPKHVDELVQICNISAISILPVLLNLEMKGVVESCGGGSYALASAWKEASTGDP